MSKEYEREELQNELLRQTNLNEKFLQNIESFSLNMEKNMRTHGRNISPGEKQHIEQYKNGLKNAIVATILIHDKIEINFPQDREQNNIDKEATIKKLNEKFSKSFRNQYSKEEQQKLREVVNKQLYSTNNPNKIDQYKYQYKTQENKFLTSGKNTGDKIMDNKIIDVLTKQANVELVSGNNKSLYNEETLARIKENIESLKELKKDIKNKNTIKYIDSKIAEFSGENKNNGIKQTIAKLLDNPKLHQIKNALDKFNKSKSTNKSNIDLNNNLKNRNNKEGRGF